MFVLLFVKLNIVKNHGIHEEVISAALDVAKTYFDLPLETKLIVRRALLSSIPFFQF